RGGARDPAWIPGLHVTYPGGAPRACPAGGARLVGPGAGRAGGGQPRRGPHVGTGRAGRRRRAPMGVATLDVHLARDSRPLHPLSAGCRCRRPYPASNPSVEPRGVRQHRGAVGTGRLFGVTTATSLVVDPAQVVLRFPVAECLAEAGPAQAGLPFRPESPPFQCPPVPWRDISDSPRLNHIVKIRTGIGSTLLLTAGLVAGLSRACG